MPARPARYPTAWGFNPDVASTAGQWNPQPPATGIRGSVAGGGGIYGLLSSLLGGNGQGLRGLLGGGSMEGSRDSEGQIDFESQMPGRWSGESATPEGWVEGEAFSPSVSPEEVIKTSQPRIMEEMKKNMATAAARLGQAGVPITSGGYAEKLGEAGRKATSDIGNLIARYKHQAAREDADRQWRADQARRDRSLGEWGTRSGYEYGAGQADLDRSLREHGMAGDWLMRGQGQDLQAQIANQNVGMDRFRMLFPLLQSLTGGV